jgi:hypothetical protein
MRQDCVRHVFDIDIDDFGIVNKAMIYRVTSENRTPLGIANLELSRIQKFGIT